MPKLSVITINYNNVAGLERTLQSVCEQSFTDFEYIVIDGGSTDGSVEAIKKQAQKISYWVSEKDRGIYHAMNKGIAKAGGQYCLFLNSGDHLVNNGILEKVFALNYTEYILYGELIFDYGDKQIQLAKRPEKLGLEHLFHDNIWHPATFIKRKLFMETGLYNEKYRIAADYDFFIHALIVKKASHAYLPFVISVFDTTGVSTQPENLQKVNAERDAILRSYLAESEMLYFQNLEKFKSKQLAKWLVNKPGMNRLFNRLLNMYSKLRN